MFTPGPAVSRSVTARATPSEMVVTSTSHSGKGPSFHLCSWGGGTKALRAEPGLALEEITLVEKLVAPAGRSGRLLRGGLRRHNRPHGINPLRKAHHRMRRSVAQFIERLP